MRAPLAFAAYPGGDLVSAGLDDLAKGIETIHALLVSVGAARLRAAGLDVPAEFPDPERRLYDALARENADAAHGRYNALIRRLSSFEHAIECAR